MHKKFNTKTLNVILTLKVPVTFYFFFFFFIVSEKIRLDIQFNLIFKSSAKYFRMTFVTILNGS